MWIDAEGNLHTVALPDPTQVVSQEFLASLRDVVRSKRRAKRLLELLEGRVDDLWSLLDDDTADLPRFEELRGEIHDGVLLGDSFSTTEELLRMIDAVAIEWRLDAVRVVDDLLHEELW